MPWCEWIIRRALYLQDPWPFWTSQLDLKGCVWGWGGNAKLLEFCIIGVVLLDSQHFGGQFLHLYQTMFFVGEAPRPAHFSVDVSKALQILWKVLLLWNQKLHSGLIFCLGALFGGLKTARYGYDQVIDMGNLHDIPDSIPSVLLHRGQPVTISLVPQKVPPTWSNFVCFDFFLQVWCATLMSEKH